MVDTINELILEAKELRIKRDKLGTSINEELEIIEEHNQELKLEDDLKVEVRNRTIDDETLYIMQQQHLSMSQYLDFLSLRIGKLTIEKVGQ